MTGGVSRIPTPGFHGFSVQWSPFFPDRLAIAACANYGIAGNGRIYVAGGESFGRAPLGPGSGPVVAPEVVQHFDTRDGVYDVCWHERHENQLVSAQGDGTVKLWDLTLPTYPIRNYHEHGREVMSVAFNPVSKGLFASGSWDCSIKLWDPQASKSLLTFRGEHTQCVYGVAWSPREDPLLASCSGDGSCKVWDVRRPPTSTTTLPHAHAGAEVLSLDWNKYQPHLLVSGGVDGTVRVHDLRSPAIPLHVLAGHRLAVRRVQASPHHGGLVGSVSYDMTLRLWDVEAGRELACYSGHTEFVSGLDFHLFRPGQVATCAWDGAVDVQQLPLPGPRVPPAMPGVAAMSVPASSPSAA